MLVTQVQIRCLADDYSRYLKSFKLFLERSSEHQCMRDFIRNTLPDVLTTVGVGKSSLNVMGVGSGAGEIDLEILTQLHAKHPEAQVENDMVEPSGDMLYKYKDLVAKTPGLDHITFRFSKMTASEFESDWKQRNTDRKLDFIHMIQETSRSSDAVLRMILRMRRQFPSFRSLLHKDGKLLITLVSGQSGWGRLWRTYRQSDISQCITSGDVRNFLDAKGIPYQSHSLLSQMDITECFTAGDEKGELLLDFLTEVLEFSKNSSPELKAGVLELLKHPECSRELDGRIIFNNNLEALVLTP